MGVCIALPFHPLPPFSKHRCRGMEPRASSSPPPPVLHRADTSLQRAGGGRGGRTAAVQDRNDRVGMAGVGLGFGWFNGLLFSLRPTSSLLFPYRWLKAHLFVYVNLLRWSLVQEVKRRLASRLGDWVVRYHLTLALQKLWVPPKFKRSLQASVHHNAQMQTLAKSSKGTKQVPDEFISWFSKAVSRIKLKQN